MLLDALATFLPVGGPGLVLSGQAGLIAPSLIYDIAGSGVGTPPGGGNTGNIIGNRATFGTDTGIGGNKPLVQSNVATAFATATGATLNVAFQAAADTGAAGAPPFQPGAWTTLIETGFMPVANLTLGAVIGRFDFPPAIPAGLNPRFLRLLYTVAAGTSFTAGKIGSAIVTMHRDDWAVGFTPRNYTVA